MQISLSLFLSLTPSLAGSLACLPCFPFSPPHLLTCSIKIHSCRCPVHSAVITPQQLKRGPDRPGSHPDAGRCGGNTDRLTFSCASMPAAGPSTMVEHLITSNHGLCPLSSSWEWEKGGSTSEVREVFVIEEVVRSGSSSSGSSQL